MGYHVEESTALGNWRYEIAVGPRLVSSGYRPNKPAATEAAREDMKLARLFFTQPEFNAASGDTLEPAGGSGNSRNSER